MSQLIEEYKKIYGEINNKFEYSLLFKTNDILRKCITSNNKNIPIEELIEKNQLILEDFDKLKEFIEKEKDNNIKTTVLDLIKELKDFNQKLICNNKQVSNPDITIFEEINEKKYYFLFLEYQLYEDIFNKINDIKKQILNLFTEESINILFTKETYKVLCISYGDTKERKCQIYDKFNNCLIIEPSKSGNIFLNQKYYNDKTKIEFYHSSIINNKEFFYPYDNFY